jgi:hypothetical protein
MWGFTSRVCRVCETFFVTLAFGSPEALGSASLRHSLLDRVQDSCRESLGSTFVVRSHTGRCVFLPLLLHH